MSCKVNYVCVLLFSCCGLMKRVGGIWDTLCSYEVLHEAMMNAAKGKRKYYCVRKILRRKDHYIGMLRGWLLDGTFRPSTYVVDMVKTEYGKEREIRKLPFFPDRVVQHAISLVLRERWAKALNDDTYACLKGRGINCRNIRYDIVRKVKRVVGRFHRRRLWCLKMDIRKCYPSVDNDVLAWVNRKYCKDRKVLSLLDMLNYQVKGLPIGNYLSQLWINVLLNELDRFVKETMRVRYYFRYMDDVVVLSDSKSGLHECMYRIMQFVHYVLHMEMNDKRQVFEVTSTRRGRGLDFVGYVFHRGFTLLRKRVKQAFAKRRNRPLSVPSYLGIAMHCDSVNLVRKVLDFNNVRNFVEGMLMKLSDTGVKISRAFEGARIRISELVGKPITILGFDTPPSKKRNGTTFLRMALMVDGRRRVCWGDYSYLTPVLQKVVDEGFEFPMDTVIHYRHGYYFEDTLEGMVESDYTEPEMPPRRGY